MHKHSLFWKTATLAKIIGILGAGQLAQMLSVAAHKLKLKTLCLAQSEDDCAHRVTDIIVAGENDTKNWEAFAEQVDIVTLETENIDLELAEFMQVRKPLKPNKNALAVAQDRAQEKQLAQSLTIETAPFSLIETEQDLKTAIKTLGFPSILKTRRFGYDGKGQYLLKNEDDAGAAWKNLQGQLLVLEGFVNFDREVSLIGARSTKKEVAFYPLVENVHEAGILRKSTAPFNNYPLQKKAEQIMQTLMDELKYTGIMTIEFFVCGDTLVLNEIAPRVHNSGHWTIEGAETSQFEQHLRAITGMPLGSTKVNGTVIMHNCIGEMPDKETVQNTPHTFYHSYGKTPRPGRKLGHITSLHN